MDAVFLLVCVMDAVFSTEFDKHEPAGSVAGIEELVLGWCCMCSLRV